MANTLIETSPNHGLLEGRQVHGTSWCQICNRVFSVSMKNSLGEKIAKIGMPCPGCEEDQENEDGDWHRPGHLPERE